MTPNLRTAAHLLYARQLRNRLAGGTLPHHVALIMDGNRRWARGMGFDNVSIGHRYGAEHIEQVLDWCADLGIRHVTIFAASTDNLRHRAGSEVQFLIEEIERSVARLLARPANRWRLRIAGQLDLLPERSIAALSGAERASATSGAGGVGGPGETGGADSELTIALGYGGRQELVDAFRALLAERARAGTGLAELAATITVEDIAEHLYTAGQPDPDLVIRTSGEQRLSGFLLWQSAYSELYFCDVYWPGFRQVDFLRALRSYAARQRRYGR